MNGTGLQDEESYDHLREDELFRRRAAELGLSRRSFLRRLAAVSGTAAAISLIRPERVHGQITQAIVKPAPAEFFIKSGSNLEMRWEAMYNRGLLVPTELFFVRNNSPTVPRVDQASWRLRIDGSGIARPQSFTYDDLLSMPSISLIRAIECAGNGRNFFQFSHGKKVPGTPWFLGGIGVAEWTGVPLREVLSRTGVKRSARDVMPEGLDSLNVKRPMSIEKAMASDTLLVYGMNGQPLWPDHGFPVRMLVPGWVGIANTKWVGRIEVSEQSLYSEWNTKKYVLIGPGYKPNPPALGPALTTQKVKSAFELPWDGAIPAGKRLLRGRSWSGEGRIAKVEVSLDGGRTWKLARLREPNIELAWTRWDLEWNATPGTHNLQARATDSKGNRQPDRIPWNDEGYAHWAVVTHSIKVI